MLTWIDTPTQRVMHRYIKRSRSARGENVEFKWEKFCVYVWERKGLKILNQREKKKKLEKSWIIEPNETKILYLFCFYL